MAGQILSTLEKLNKLIVKEGISPFKFGLANPNDLVLLEKNARFMKKEMFDTLVKGIQLQGLSSLPFCYRDGDRDIVLSGNHRVMASRAAGVKQILYLYTDAEMSKQEQIACQLAHNQVTGEDDPQILKELWSEIQDLDLKEITGFDDDFFERLEPIEFQALTEPPIKTRSVTLVFMEHDLDKFNEALEQIKAEAGKDPAYLARFSDFNAFFELVLTIKEDMQIINTATAIAKMVELAQERIQELRESLDTEAGG